MTHPLELDFADELARLTGDKRELAARVLEALAGGRRLWVEERALPGVEWDALAKLDAVWLITATGALWWQAGQTLEQVRVWW